MQASRFVTLGMEARITCAKVQMTFCQNSVPGTTANGVVSKGRKVCEACLPTQATALNPHKMQQTPAPATVYRHGRRS